MAKRVMKEISILQRSISDLTGGQAKYVGWETDEVSSVLVQLSPASGYYKGDAIDFKLEIDERYPADAPTVICLSNIYHPNIDPSSKDDGNVCLNLLEYGFWCEGFGLQGCIFGLLYLLENPNFDDPINPFFQFRETTEEYKRDIDDFRQGKRVGFIECLLDEAIEISAPVPSAKASIDMKNVCTGNEHCTSETDDVDTNYDTIGDTETTSTFEKYVDDTHIETGSNTFVTDTIVNDNCNSEQHFDIVSNSKGHDLLEQQAYMLTDKTAEEHKTKRQISEDNIVSASNKIFLKASGEEIQGNLRRPSLDDGPDFEELLYRHFMCTESES